MQRFQGRPVTPNRFGGRRITGYDTDQGRAAVTTQPDGTPWLDTGDGRTGTPDQFGNPRPVYAQPLAQQPQGDGSVVVPRQRDLGERFTSVVTDAARRNPIVAAARYFMGREPDQVHTDPTTGQPFTYRSIGGQMRDDERERRDAYETMSRSDGWRQAQGGPVGQALAGATNVAGAITGAAADPTSIIGGPGKTILGRFGGNLVVNAAGDVVTQAADIGSDLQDKYSLLQTAASAAIGSVLQGGLEVAPHVPGAVVRGGRATARFTGRLVEQAADRLPNPVPRFDGLAVDTGPVRQTASPAPSNVAPSARPRRQAPPAIQGAITRASEASGVPLDYMTALAERESGFDPSIRARTSSATGLFQFTDDTWLGTLRQHGRELGIPDAEARIAADPDAVLRMRTDPELNSRAAALLTQDNATALRGVLGREPTPGELYSAHFLGEGRARQLAGADPQANAAQLFPDAARANRSIFFDGRRPRTVAEIRANFDSTFGHLNARPSAGTSGEAPPMRVDGGQGQAPASTVPAQNPGPADGRYESPRQRPDYAALVQQDMEANRQRLADLAPPRARFDGRPVEDSPAPRRQPAPAQSPLPEIEPMRLDMAPMQMLDMGPAHLPYMDLLGPQRSPPSPNSTPRLSMFGPQENALSPTLPGFRVDLPGIGSRVMGAVQGDVRPDGTWRVRNAELPPALRGQGLGVRSYIQAAREAEAAGARLTSDAEVTPAAARVWEGMARRGYQIERNPAAMTQSRGGAADTMGMGPTSIRTQDGSPVYRVTQSPPQPFVSTVPPRPVDGGYRPGSPQTFRAASPSQGVQPNAGRLDNVADFRAAPPSGSPRFSGVPIRDPLASSPLRTNTQEPGGLGPNAELGPLRRPAGEAIGPLPADQQLGPIAPRFGGRPVEAQPTGRLALGSGQGRLPIDLSAYADRVASGGQGMPQAQGIGGLREAPRPGAVPRGQGAVYEGQTVASLARDLRTSLGLTQRQGRLTMRGASGEYDTGSAVIRTKAVQELDVLAHEATHALEYQRRTPALQAALEQHAAELRPLAYPGAAKDATRQEGFAEWGRWYLTNPEQARTAAPNFYAAFEQAIASDNPRVAADLKGIQSAYQNLLRSDSIAVAKGSLAYTGSKGPLSDLGREFKERGPGSTIGRLADSLYTAIVDDAHPISVAVRKLTQLYNANTGRPLHLKRADDPYALTRLAKEAYASGHNDIVFGVTPYRGLDPEGVSLSDALETADIARSITGKWKNDALKEFDVYLVARRMIHEWDRFARGELPRPPDRNTRAFHEQVIADAEAAHPTWQQASAQVYDWLGALWKKERDAGLITDEAYQNGLQIRDYVPLMRDVSDKGAGSTGRPRGTLQFAGGVKQFGGSTRDVISPLSSMMRRSYELSAVIKKNDAIKALDDLAQAAGPGSGGIVERLPAQQMEAWTADAASVLSRTADELGLTGRDLSTIQKIAEDAQDESITLFRSAGFEPKKGEQVVFAWRDGKKQPLLLPDGEFGREMFNALAGMGRDQRNAFVDMVAAPTQMLRYGVTMSPEFMAANLIRDQIATWINTNVGFKPVIDTLRGGADELSQSTLPKRYANAGGMRGGANVAATGKPFPQDDRAAMAQLQHLRTKGMKVRRFASWRGLAEATDLSETSTRMGVFRQAFDKAKHTGITDYEALIEAGFTSRDYLDFGRRGSKMVTASRLVTFLNAALQGLDKTVRVLSAGGNLHRALQPLTGGPANTPAQKAAIEHAMKAWVKVSALGAVGLGLRMLYADDPEYQEIGDQLRATHWVFRTNGQWNFVPKPFELATISNILERGYEGIVLKDPTAGERLLSDFKNTVVPPYEAPAVAIPFQVAMNRDRLGRPIVPDHLRGAVDPDQQFNSYTSALGKVIGRVLNVSPAVVDHVFTGFTGSLGRYALQASDMAMEGATGTPRTAAGPEDMFLARRFVRDVNRGSTSQKEFWDQVSRDGGDMTQSLGTFRQLASQAKDGEAIAYLNRLPPAERAYAKATYFTQDGSQKFHPMVRATESLSVISDLRRTVRDGSILDNSGARITLTPEQRRDVDDALGAMATVEMRNALIASGIRGWSQRQMMDRAEPERRLIAASPAIAAALNQGLMLNKVPNEAMVMQAWSQLRPVMETPVPEQPGVMALRARRMRGDLPGQVLEMQRMRAAQRGGH